MLASLLRKVDRLQRDIVEPLSHLENKQDDLMAAIKSIKKKDKRQNIDNYKVFYDKHDYCQKNISVVNSQVDIALKISKLYCRSLYRELSDEQYAVSSIGLSSW